LRLIVRRVAVHQKYLAANCRKWLKPGRE
jgi:hypothetical protein